LQESAIIRMCVREGVLVVWIVGIVLLLTLGSAGLCVVLSFGVELTVLRSAARSNASETPRDEAAVSPPVAGSNATERNGHLTRIFFFIHVPKCAGWETWQAIKEIANAGHVCERPEPVVLWPPGKSWRNAGCASGGNSMGIHCSLSEISDCYESGNMQRVDKGHCVEKEWVMGKKDRPVYHVYPIRTFKFITVLREPVDRVVSEFYWWKPWPLEPAWDQPLHRASSQDNLTAWALSPHNNAHNRMTKQVAFLPSMRAPSSAFLHLLRRRVGEAVLVVAVRPVRGRRAVGSGQPGRRAVEQCDPIAA